MDYEKLLYIVLAILLGYLIIHGPSRLQAQRAKGKRLDSLATVLPDGAELAGRYLLYFWSPSCGMCRNTTRLIEQLMAERDDVISINVLDDMVLAHEIGIMGTPAVVLVENKQVRRIVLGQLSYKQLLNILAH